MNIQKDYVKQSYIRQNIFRKEVLPFLSQKLPPILATNFGNYLNSYYDDEISEKLYFWDQSGFISFKFLERFKDKCIGYCSMPPDKVSVFGFYRVIYQLSNSLHAQLGIGIFFEGEEYCKICVSNSFASEDINEMHSFLEKNEDLILTNLELHPAENKFGFSAGVFGGFNNSSIAQ